MGYRANYIVKRDAEWVHTTSQADALDIDSNFIFGPDVALRFLAPWPQWDFGAWQIETSCQGGALVDTDARVFAFFSDQLGYADRAVLLDTLRRTWAGWEVVWAYNGLSDLLRHIGISPEEARRFGTRHERELYPFGRTEVSGPVWTLVTVVDEDGVRAYGLDGDAVHPWWVGPDVVTMFHADTRIDSCTSVPDAGLHLDLRTRTAGLWTAITSLHDIAEDWPALWPGWSLDFWGDDYGRQLRGAGRAVTVADVNRSAARARLAMRVAKLWQPFLTTNAEAYFEGLGVTRDQLRDDSWYSYVAIQTAVTPDDLDGALAAIASP